MMGVESAGGLGGGAAAPLLELSPQAQPPLFSLTFTVTLTLTLTEAEAESELPEAGAT